MDALAQELSLTWQDAGLGVVAGVGVYLAVILITRLFGQRSLSSVSSFDFPVTVAVGAIVGRTALVHTSLLGGVIALVTLFAIQAGVGWLRNNTRIGTIVDNPPILLVRDGEILTRNLRSAHMTEEDLIGQLRRRGVPSLARVGACVLERSGAVSVIQGDHIDPRMLRRVLGAEEQGYVANGHGERP